MVLRPLDLTRARRALSRPAPPALALVAVVLASALAGCSHGPKPVASTPEPQHRDSRVPPDAGIERDGTHDDDDDDDDDRDAKKHARTTRKGYEQRGVASYYAKKFEGRKTASGERYRGRELTAAHLTLPFGTRVRVTNLSNGRSVDVVVNDRGPHKKGRIVDLSRSAAEEIGLIAQGVTKVVLEVLEVAETESAARE